jgi:glycopeptide antibiotics resistance protein
MISTYLAEHASLVPLALSAVILVCVVIGYLVVRSRWHGALLSRVLAVLSLVAVLALTLSPTSRVGAPGCTVQLDLSGLAGVESLANLGLFVPLALFTTLATRRPLLTLVTASALSAAIELAQVLVPALGRACDTHDWVMNTGGAILGAVLGAGTVALGGRRARSRGRP